VRGHRGGSNVPPQGVILTASDSKFVTPRDDRAVFCSRAFEITSGQEEYLCPAFDPVLRTRVADKGHEECD